MAIAPQPRRGVGMAMPADVGARRRDALILASAACLLLGFDITEHRPEHDRRQLPASERRDFIAAVSGSLLPATETPGAADAQTLDYVDRLMLSGGDWHDLEAFCAELGVLAGRRFLDCDSEARTDVLTVFDRYAMEVANKSSTANFWRSLKATILAGYYTSETGATKELQYELVPGRYDPDVILPPRARAWSSDWRSQWVS